MYDKRALRRTVRKAKVSATRTARKLIIFVLAALAFMYFAASNGAELDAKEKEREFQSEREMYQQEISNLKSGQVLKSGKVNQSELLVKSNTTPEQLNKFLASWKGSKLVGWGYSFKAAEHETGLNSDFLCAVAVHESRFGTNTISIAKNNIFSINAVDKSPVKSAYTYTTKTECIIKGALLLKNQYLTPKGKYYNGTSLEAINKCYASDKNWANCIRGYMKQIKGVKL